MKRNKEPKILVFDRPSLKLNYVEQYLVYKYEGNFAFHEDDIVLLAHRHEDIQWKTNEVAAIGRQVGLNIQIKPK